MSALNPADIRRLKAILSRLGSNHEGEVIAAAAAANRILAKVGLDFGDLDVVPAPPPNTRSFTPIRPARAELLHSWQRDAFLLLVSGYAWDDWKRNFLTDIRHRRHELTPAQAAKLRECRRMADAGRVAA